MDKWTVTSIRKSAGKTSVILGIAKALGKRVGYMKPFGDRLLYRKKRLWDYDSALFEKILGLEEDAGEMSIGFDHSKLRYMYDEQDLKDKLLESMSAIRKDKDLLFIERGKDITHGTSVHLDAISVAKYMDSKLLVVVSGYQDSIVDDITFIKKYIDMKEVNFKGVIINKVDDVEDFKEIYLSDITEMGINILGIIPYKKELMSLSVSYLSGSLFAKVIAGDAGLNNIVENIFVGAASANAALRDPLFKRGNKLLITSGDRSEMLIAALDSDTACIILTNNILPSSNIISKASQRNIPLLLVPYDTFQAAKKVDDLEILLTKDDTEKIELLEKLIRKYVNLKEIE